MQSVSEESFIERAADLSLRNAVCRQPDGTVSVAHRRAARRLVYGYYDRYGRTFPWRETRDAYRILVSEVMLQQTQTARVAGYYDRFLEHFPSIAALAEAPLRDLLGQWKGLGYNRRALMLKRAAQSMVADHGGGVPLEEQALRNLPGIGTYTARAVMVFAANKPAVCIETNIRTAIFRMFFRGAERIRDRDVESVAAQIMDRRDPRTWHYALMDIGAAIKRRVRGNALQSAHYRPQSRFDGSRRQLRAKILHSVTDCGSTTLAALFPLADGSETWTKELVRELVEEMTVEGLLARTGGRRITIGS